MNLIVILGIEAAGLVAMCAPWDDMRDWWKYRHLRRALRRWGELDNILRRG